MHTCLVFPHRSGSISLLGLCWTLRMLAYSTSCRRLSLIPLFLKNSWYATLNAWPIANAIIRAYKNHKEMTESNNNIQCSQHTFDACSTWQEILFLEVCTCCSWATPGTAESLFTMITRISFTSVTNDTAHKWKDISSTCRHNIIHMYIWTITYTSCVPKITIFLTFDRQLMIAKFSDDILSDTAKRGCLSPAGC